MEFKPSVGFFFYALVLALGLASSLHAESLEEKPGAGLELKSIPSGADVYLDGIKRGKTPLLLADMPVGTYQVLMSLEGYLDRKFKVQVKEGFRSTVTLDLLPATGTVFVRPSRSVEAPGYPFRPTIRVDDKETDASPLTLPVGIHTIRVRAFGWEDGTRTILVLKDSVSLVEISLKPALFVMGEPAASRRRFNPYNPGLLGATDLAFQVNAPGSARLSISDSLGTEVYYHAFRRFDSWSQTVGWDGRGLDGEILPDGEYTVSIQGESLPWDGTEPVRQTLRIETKIDSNLFIRPAALASGSSGYLYCPSAELLPAYSFQFDAGMLLGTLYPGSTKDAGAVGSSLDSAAFSAPPFSVGFVLSPVDGWTAAAALNVVPGVSGPAALTLGGTVSKYLGLVSLGGDIGAALNLKYAWSGSGRTSPFGTTPGIDISLPFSRVGKAPLSFTLSPGLLFTGPEGFPAESLPRGTFAAGLSYRLPFLAAGLSSRAEVNFTAPQVPRVEVLFTGVELRLLPPPSIFVVALNGGLWVSNPGHDGSPTGFFAGFNIGLIH